MALSDLWDAWLIINELQMALKEQDLEKQNMVMSQNAFLKKQVDKVHELQIELKMAERAKKVLEKKYSQRVLGNRKKAYFDMVAMEDKTKECEELKKELEEAEKELDEQDVVIGKLEGIIDEKDVRIAELEEKQMSMEDMMKELQEQLRAAQLAPQPQLPLPI